MTTVDAINPSHYRSHASGIEVIEITERQNFCIGNATKYLARAGLKNDEIEDLKKSHWYLLREINSSRHGGTDAVGQIISDRYLKAESNENLYVILKDIFEYSFSRKPRTQSPLIDALLNLEDYIKLRS